MSIAQGSAIVNTEHIDSLRQQIEASTDCEVILLIVRTHTKQVKDLINASIRTQAAILKNYLPLLKLPGARPSKIIKWIKKLVSGTIVPQLRAFVTLAIQIARLAVASTELALAISQSKERLKRCVTEQVIDQLLWDMDQAILETQDAFTGAGTTIGELREGLGAYVNLTSNTEFDFSSPENFVNTAPAVLNNIEFQVGQLLGSDIDFAPEPGSGTVGNQEGGEVVDLTLYDVRIEDGVAVEKIAKPYTPLDGWVYVSTTTEVLFINGIAVDTRTYGD